MSAEKGDSFAFKADEQALELIKPSKGAFGHKALLVDVCVEETFRSWFARLAIAFVRGNVRTQTMLKACFACVFGVKGGIGIEISLSV